MSKLLQLQIITPARIVFNGSITSFTAPGVEGSFQILYNHAPFLSALAIGPMKVVMEDGGEKRYATSGGFTHIYQNRIMVLAETAEEAGSIDVARAKESKRRAEQRLEARDQLMDEERAKASLHRAINRLRVAGAM